MRISVLTPPSPSVTLSETKVHLRVEGTDEDALISAYIAAATGHIDGPDGWLGRSIGVQTLELRDDVFRDCMHLAFGPVLEVISVKYLAADGSEDVVPSTDYELRGWLIGSAFGKRWPSVLDQPEAVRIQYRAGYEVLPAPIRAAILLMVGDLYENRESVAVGSGASLIPMSTTVESLLAPFRVFA